MSGATLPPGESVVPTTDPAAAGRLPIGEAFLERDLAYDGALRLDLAGPRAGGACALALLLHGGGWEGGDKRSMHDELAALARLGYLAASPDYTLARAGRPSFPRALDDARRAAGWLRARAGGRDLPLVVVGVSAGAHLAALLAVAPGDVGDAAAAMGARPAAALLFAGPQDLRTGRPHTAEQARVVTTFLGAHPADRPDIAAAASPLVHAPSAAGAPPFLLVHGADDRTVLPTQAHEMAAALRAGGGRATVLELPGVGHGWVGLATSHDRLVRCTVRAFLARWASARPAG